MLIEYRTSPEELFTEEEVKTIINQYLTSKCLFKPDDPKFVNVAQDRLLLDTVLNGKEGGRAGLLEKKFMNTNEVINRIINSTKSWYKVSTGDKQPIIRLVLRFRHQTLGYSSSPREGTLDPISVNVVRRHNHTVTYISGFEIFRLDANSLAEELKAACASSSTVQTDPRNPESKQIMVQGEHVKVVAECLVVRGIQRRWIEVINHTRVEKIQTGKRGPM